jgi:hypothetical protein
VGQRFEFRASRYFTALATPPMYFSLVILEIGLPKLFAQAVPKNCDPPDLSLLSS